MKRSLTLVCILASTIVAGSVASTYRAQAQSAEPPSAPVPAGTEAPETLASTSKVAVIAFQQAVAATNEGQRNFAQLRTKYEPKQAALKAQNDEIDSLKKQLQDAGASLNEQERDSRMQAIDAKTKALQRQAEDAQNDFQSDMGTMYQALAQKVYAVMDVYAKEHGYTLILDATQPQQQNSSPSPILWQNECDISKAVVEAYNRHSGISPPASGASSAPRSTRPSTRTPQ